MGMQVLLCMVTLQHGHSTATFHSSQSARLHADVISAGHLVYTCSASNHAAHVYGAMLLVIAD
jgi:hypothetical protein